MDKKYKYLKVLKDADSSFLYKLFKNSGLSENEYWVMVYYLIKDNLRENTCMKLSISTSTYRNIQSVALAKVHHTFMNKINQMFD